jgi:hypothetical protein
MVTVERSAGEGVIGVAVRCRYSKWRKDPGMENAGAIQKQADLLDSRERV